MYKTNRILALLLSLVAALPALGEPAEAPAAVDQIAKGLLMKHGERLILAPCRDRSYVNVDDVSQGAVVTATLTDFGLAEGKSLYVEFMGKLDGGLLRVSALNLARREARCWQSGGADELWRAAGNSPGWTLAVGAGQLRLSREGKADLNTAYSNIEHAAGAVRIATGEMANADWRFRRQACVDKAAGVLFAWQAEVKVDGEVLRGCAWQR